MVNSILCTGGSGFFSRAFVEDCLKRGVPRICIYSRGEARQAAMRAELGDPPSCRWLIGDIRDRARLRRAMEGVDTVLHSAALKRVEVGEYNPSEMVSTNVGGTQNVIEASIDAGVEHVIALSSDKACAPLNCYGATKLVAEKLFAAAGALCGNRVQYSVIRYGNVAASTGSVIPTWRAAVAGGQQVVLTDPAATRFWLTVSEAVGLVWRAIETRDPFFVPTMPAYALGDLAEAMGVSCETFSGLRPGEKLHESILAEYEPGGPVTSDEARRMTITELREALGSV